MHAPIVSVSNKVLVRTCKVGSERVERGYQEVMVCCFLFFPKSLGRGLCSVRVQLTERGQEQTWPVTWSVLTL